MNLKSFRKSLLENTRFLIFGQEDYFISYAAEVLKTKLNKDFASFNYTEIDQKTTLFKDFYITLESVPMMDSLRVIHLKNFQFVQGTSNLWTKEENVKFKDIIDKLDPAINLLVSSSAVEVKSENNNKKSTYPKLLTEISNIMTTFPVGNLNAREFEEYIAEEIREKTDDKIKLEKDNIRYYMDLSGYLFKDNTKTIREINAEIDKILSYLKEKGSISNSEIDSLFIREFDSDVFKLIDCIIKNQKQQAFVIYSNLVKKGEPAIKILATVASSLSTMIKASYYVEKGYTQAMAAQVMGKHPYAIKIGLENLKGIGRKKALRCLEVIIKTDYEFKTGMLQENVYAEIALSRIFASLSEIQA